MASLVNYKGLQVVESPSGDGGQALTDDFMTLGDRAPNVSDSDPGSTDDDSKGYFAGSMWLNKTSQTLWMCVDATVTAAVWKSVYRRTTTNLELIPDETDGSVSISGGLSSIGLDAGFSVSNPDQSAQIKNFWFPRNGDLKGGWWIQF
ncbi:hypothetical protein [Rubinisphaera italica]|uniref:Uncharacterized protein n=1 Tax=Rubinisphaera italica TaxID=2527969 RepID=A0A5C5XHC0_9PLAN|nr:hypothetical protein [Rubinisphaera italica]TWT61703.1 hypothetical protein Pan54_24400 [Rubinisphaera italica]